MSTAKSGFFSWTQLQKLHRQFCHPSAARLYQILQKTWPEDVEASTLDILNDLTRRCVPFQRVQSAPTIFRVSFGSEIVQFNGLVVMGIMYLNYWPVINLVDEGSLFSAAKCVLKCQRQHSGHQPLSAGLQWTLAYFTRSSSIRDQHLKISSPASELRVRLVLKTPILVLTHILVSEKDAPSHCNQHSENWAFNFPLFRRPRFL